jgi:hypothetical protein
MYEELKEEDTVSVCVCVCVRVRKFTWLRNKPETFFLSLFSLSYSESPKKESVLVCVFEREKEK